jgi:hypothetical protein
MKDKRQTTILFAAFTNTPFGALQGRGRTMQVWISPAVVACTFCKSILLDKRVSPDLHRWLTYGDLTRLESVFGYHLSEDEFQAPRATFDSDRLKLTRQPKARGRSR